MRRRLFLITLFLFASLFFIAWRTPQVPSPGRHEPRIPMGNATPFQDSLAKTDLKHLNRTLGTAQGAVLAFFAALKSNNLTLLRRIVSPELQGHRDKLQTDGTGTWNDWLEMWRKKTATIQSLGEPRPTVNGPDRFIVPVMNKDGSQWKIRVLKDGNTWLWNEN